MITGEVAEKLKEELIPLNELEATGVELFPPTLML